jgi:hypothetical protein
MKKPKWWTGWWLLKAVLIWLAGFLIWYPVFSKWPNSIAAKLATVLFGITMLPLMLGYGAGVLGDWIRVVGSVYGFVRGSRHRP